MSRNSKDNFATVEQLQAFLGSFNSVYTRYAGSLWDSEVRYLAQLAHADKQDLIEAGATSPIHATDIRKRALSKIRCELFNTICIVPHPELNTATLLTTVQQLGSGNAQRLYMH